MINHKMVKTVKNIKKKSDSAYSLPDDVFSDSLNSPGQAKILLNCLKIIEL